MKKYCFKKEVTAELMMLGEAESKGFALSKEPITEETKCIEGYHIRYQDGIDSWLTKEDFEKEFKCSDTFLDRLYIELEELQTKQDKLNAFFETETFKSLSKQDRTLMEAQFGAMLSYSSILIERIRIAEEKQY